MGVESCTVGALTPGEQQYVERFARSGTTELELLVRLSKYFRGKHTLDEIVWREGVEYAKLTALIRAFPTLLVTSQRSTADST